MKVKKKYSLVPCIFQMYLLKMESSKSHQFFGLKSYIQILVLGIISMVLPYIHRDRIYMNSDIYTYRHIEKDHT